MKQLNNNTHYQYLKSSSFTKFAMLISSTKDAVTEYQVHLNDHIIMNTRLIIVIGLLSSLADYANLFCSYFEANSSSMITEPQHMILRFMLITITMILMGLWLCFIKKSYHILSILAEIAYMLFSQGILSHTTVAEISHLDDIEFNNTGYEYIFIGLSFCARISLANIFIRYALLKIFYCFTMISTLVIIGIIKQTQHHHAYLYSKGILFLFYLSILVYLIERIKLKSFQRKYLLGQDDKMFKEIIGYIPQNILIIGKNSKIKYANFHLLNYFNINNEKLFPIDKFYNIKQIRQESNNESLLKMNNVKIRGKKFNEMPLEFDFSNRDQNGSKHFKDERCYHTLNELIEDLLFDSKYITDSCEFLTFDGLYTDCTISESSKSFKIKIKPRILQEELCLIIIFEEIIDGDNSIVLLAENNNNDYKNDLLLSFSHELRTPLNSQINYLEAAITDPTLSNQIKLSYLIPALQSCKLLKHLINDILDLSSIHNNTIALEVNSLSLESTLVQCIELIELQALRKNIKLELEIDPKLPHIVNTDHNKVAQIVMNLLSNSLKFTQQNGKIHMMVHFNNPHIIITIIDNGIGMTQDEQIQLKERLDNNQLKHKKRVDIGIGLTISHVLAQLLGPKDGVGLTFESEKDIGTKFSFTIVDKAEKQIQLKSSQNILSETEIRFKCSSQNEFTNTHVDHRDIRSFRLVQASSKFNSQNLHVSSGQKIIRSNNTNFEHEPNFIKLFSNEYIKSSNLNQQFDLNDQRDIPILNPVSQEKVKSPKKYRRIDKKRIIHLTDVVNYNKCKFAKSENTFNDDIDNDYDVDHNNITYDKNRLSYRHKNYYKNENNLSKKGLFNYIHVLTHNENDHIIKTPRKNIDFYNGHDLQSNNDNIDNNNNNPHYENIFKLKSKNHILEKKTCKCPEILIVDDDSFNIMSMECLLKQLKYTFSSTFNGQLAIDEIIRRESNKCSPLCQQYKLILMDFSMPIMNGIEATKILKDKMKNDLIRPIRIIACTAFGSIDKRKECIDAGMDDFMSKPIDITKLKDILSNYQMEFVQSMFF